MRKSTETKKARCAEIERKTAETLVSVKLNLDGEGKCEIATGLGFLDHMLTLLAKHSFMDLTVRAKGDLEVDSHHTVEDIGIVLGEALREALGDKAGIHRYGNCFIRPSLSGLWCGDPENCIRKFRYGNDRRIFPCRSYALRTDVAYPCSVRQQCASYY